ncbi:uncharacterized protein LOC128419218 [Podarcis raffonei]|uniref:uncharacterized protein LOC128419218 n=1 Tax=Podarcis raffonei TaxID=65483 RepID=UPI0023299A01|nr:uncharacterized protein LOC128419218 [Podarcis raffonei]
MKLPVVAAVLLISALCARETDAQWNPGLGTSLSYSGPNVPPPPPPQPPPPGPYDGQNSAYLGVQAQPWQPQPASAYLGVQAQPWQPQPPSQVGLYVGSPGPQGSGYSGSPGARPYPPPPPPPNGYPGSDDGGQSVDAWWEELINSVENEFGGKRQFYGLNLKLKSPLCA